MNRKFLMAAGILILAALFISSPLRAQSTASGASQPTGSIFQVVPTPNDNFDSNLFAAAASSSSDVWAVGQSAIHFNGTNWTAVRAPGIIGDNTSFFNGVVDISPTQAWAVGILNAGGEGGTPSQVIEQWNGTQWSVFPGPTFAPGDESDLDAVTAISADDIWAVGFLLNPSDGILSYLFEHFNGTAWAPTTIVNDGSFLTAVSADASNDVWAVGYSGFLDSDASPLVYHYNGSSWKNVPAPQVGASDQLNAVVALAPSNVWAVGTQQAAASDPTLTLIENYDGAKWTVLPSPNVGPANSFQSNRLFGITAVSPVDIWAFGSYFASNGSGNQMTLLLHYDGSTWSIEPSPNPTTKGGFLSDVLFAGVAPSAGNVWIVGSEDEAPHTSTLGIHTLTGDTIETK
jgi:hypothetical protein